ncbi:hypothetical protein GCM10010472_04190 [Pseudonocardia halophobica]|uniref:Helix-turn-helix domain-containing protein n=1 Tax=Pseudonocardia halophobica TaxID=29401 RepID=A0A9W6NY40_9PSEU|nr:helix-turn-helix domain-containing protein [Pseudonocardia halophobica]GLL13378.1 hypothetical protein GCM10017577_45210 [Pseudonocardia halophobica]
MATALSARTQTGASTRDLNWLRQSTDATVTLADCARLLHLDPRTVSRAIEDGQLPSIKVGRRILIPRLPLLQMLEGGAAA